MFYTRFKESNPTIEVGLRSFEKLRPWYVKRLCKFNSCCCRHHVQMSKLKDAFNSMKQGPVHGAACICSCRVCKPNGVHCVCAFTLSTITRVKVMCELILYPKYDIDEYHKLLCIRGVVAIVAFQSSSCVLLKWILVMKSSYLWSSLRMCLLAIMMMEVIGMQ